MEDERANVLDDVEDSSTGLVVVLSRTRKELEHGVVFAALLLLIAASACERADALDQGTADRLDDVEDARAGFVVVLDSARKERVRALELTTRVRAVARVRGDERGDAGDDGADEGETGLDNVLQVDRVALGHLIAGGAGHDLDELAALLLVVVAASQSGDAVEDQRADVLHDVEDAGAALVVVSVPGEELVDVIVLAARAGAVAARATIC